MCNSEKQGRISSASFPSVRSSIRLLLGCLHGTSGQADGSAPCTQRGFVACPFQVGTVPSAGFRGEVTGWGVKACAGSPSDRYPELHLCLLHPLHPQLCHRRSRVGWRGLRLPSAGDRVGLCCAPPSTLMVTCWDEGLAYSLSLCFYFSIIIFQGFSARNWKIPSMGCRDSLRNIQMDLNFGAAKGFAYLFSASCCLLCLRAFARSFAYACPCSSAPGNHLRTPFSYDKTPPLPPPPKNIPKPFGRILFYSCASVSCRACIAVVCCCLGASA